MITIAFIGLGGMGVRMAGRLLDAGHQVVVWNRTASKAGPLLDRGARHAASPAEAARTADAVITMLADPAALREVTEGPDGVLAGMTGGATLIEMSTVGPPAIARLAEVLPAGVDLLDAPVLGSLLEAESGTLQIFVGGSAALAERWTPVLSVLGTPRHVGPTGAGAAAKLVANSTLFGVLTVLGEALALADGLGLPRETAYEVLSTTPVAVQAERRRDVVETDGAIPTRFMLSLASKDSTLVLEAGHAVGRRMPVAEAARDWFTDADRAGRGEQDYSAVVAHILTGH